MAGPNQANPEHNSSEALKHNTLIHPLKIQNVVTCDLLVILLVLFFLTVGQNLVQLVITDRLILLSDRRRRLCVVLFSVIVSLKQEKHFLLERLQQCFFFSHNII